MPPQIHEWFAVATPGLEPVVHRELVTLGVAGVVSTGGVSFEATLEQGASLTGVVRTPSRVLLRIVQGRARSLHQLASLIRSVDWAELVTPGSQIDVAVTARRSRLSRREAIGKKVVHAINDVIRSGPRHLPKLAQRVVVRIEEDFAIVSLDAGGELLHRRGWRQRGGAAPLRENLAASMLVAAGWTGQQALLDPFCGSGTIPIEAAQLACGLHPTHCRGFAWQAWPALSKHRPQKFRRTKTGVVIVVSDKEASTLTIATDNARIAEVDVKWNHLDVKDIEPPARVGLVATNPPYGRRLGQRVRGVYVHFGRSLQDRFTGWSAIFLAPNRQLAQAVHPHSERLTTFANGGIRVGLFVIASV